MSSPIRENRAELVGMDLRRSLGASRVKRSQQFRPPVRQAAARSPLSTPRATILESSSGSGLLQTARFIPRRPHPDVSLFVCGQDHRHGLGMDRLDEGVRCRGQEPINQMRARNWFRLGPRAAPSVRPDVSEREQRPLRVRSVRALRPTVPQGS